MKDKLEILYDHYKDSFSLTISHLKQREKLFVWLLIIIFLQFIEFTESEKSLEALNQIIESKINYNFHFSLEYLTIFLWFALFSISLKYFQKNTLINKNYKYIHRVEEKICKIAKDKSFIIREGKFYLKNYSLFSNWSHAVYTWIFPLLLIFVSILRIIKDYSYTLSGVLNLLFFITICFTTLAYLWVIHKKD